MQVDLNAGAAQRVRPEAHRLFDHVVDVYRSGALLRFPREQQQILDHGFGAVALLLDQPDRFALIVTKLLFKQELREGGDPGERIVDFVRDASHEFTERDHLLRLPELFLVASIQAEVAHAHDLAEELAVVSGERADRDGGGELTAIAPAVHVVQQAHAGFVQAIDLANALTGILSGDELLELHCHELILRPLVLTRGGRIGVAHAHAIENENGIVDGGERGGVQVLAFAGHALFPVEQESVEGESKRAGEPLELGAIGERTVREILHELREQGADAMGVCVSRQRGPCDRGGNAHYGDIPRGSVRKRDRERPSDALRMNRAGIRLRARHRQSIPMRGAAVGRRQPTYSVLCLSSIGNPLIMCNSAYG